MFAAGTQNPLRNGPGRAFDGVFGNCFGFFQPIMIFSSGYLAADLSLLCRPDSASARVRGPTRPRNIMGSSTARPAWERLGVPMADTPTVPIALAASNQMSAREKRLPSIKEMTSVPSSCTVRNSIITASALRTVSAGRVRLAARTSLSPRITLTIRKNSAAAVVVFTPPPVEAGDAPTNIKYCKQLGTVP